MTSSDSNQSRSPSYVPDVVSYVKCSWREQQILYSFNDQFRKTCQGFERNLESENVNLCDLRKRIEEFEHLVGLPVASNLSSEEIESVLIMMLTACVKVQSIEIFKQACQFLCRWMLSTPNIFNVINISSLEDYVVEFGKKIHVIGDYTSQTLMLEVLIRICSSTHRELWAKKIFAAEDIQNLFLQFNPTYFDMECRNFLNCFNKSEYGSDVYSFVVRQVRLGPFEIEKPGGMDYWIDLNYGSKSISFYCINPFLDKNSLEASSIPWEQINISSSDLKSCTLIVDRIRNVKELILNVRHSYLENMNFRNLDISEFDGTQFRISFHMFFGIHPHLKNIFGNLYEGEKFITCKKKKKAIRMSRNADDVDSLSVPKEAMPPVPTMIHEEIEGCYEQHSPEILCLSPSEKKISDEWGSQRLDAVRKNITGEKASVVRFHFNCTPSEDFCCAGTEDSLKGVKNNLSMANNGPEATLEIEETQGSPQPDVQKDKNESGRLISPQKYDLLEPVRSSQSSNMVLCTPTVEHRSSLINEDEDLRLNSVRRNSDENAENETSKVLKPSEEVINVVSVFSQENVKEFHSEGGAQTVSLKRKRFFKNDLTKTIEYNESEINLISEDENFKNDEMALNKNSSHISLAEEIDSASHFIKESETKVNKEKKEVFDGDSTVHKEESAVLSGKRPAKRIHLFKSDTAPMLAISPEVTASQEPVVPAEIPASKKQKTSALQTSKKKRQMQKKTKRKVSAADKNNKKDSGMQTIDASFLCHEMGSPKSDSGIAKNAEFPDVHVHSPEVPHSLVDSAKDQMEKSSAVNEADDSGFVTFTTGAAAVEKTRFVTLEQSTVQKEVPEKCSVDVSHENVIPERKAKSGRAAARKSMEKTQKMLTENTNIASHSNRDSDFTTKSSEKKKKAPRKSSTSKARDKKADLLQEDLNKITSSDWSSIEKFQLVTDKKRNFKKPTVNQTALQHLDSKNQVVFSQPPRSTDVPNIISSPSSIMPDSSSLRNFTPAKSARNRTSTVLSSCEKNMVQPPITQKQVPSDQNNENFDDAGSYEPVNEPCYFSDTHDREISKKAVQTGSLPKEILSTDMPDGKADHLRRFLKDISMSQSYESKEMDSESVKTVRGSPVPSHLTASCSFRDSHDQNSYHKRHGSYSSEDYSWTKKRVHSKEHERDPAQRPGNRGRKRKYKESEQFAASDHGCTSSSTADDISTFDHSIPAEFFSEARSLSQKLLASLRKFVAQFFERMVLFRRKLFYAMTSPFYDNEQLRLAKDIVEYSKYSLSIETYFQKKVKRMRHAFKIYTTVEEEFDRRLKHFMNRGHRKFVKKMHLAGRKIVYAEQAKLLAELKTQLQHVIHTLSKNNFL